MVDAAKMYDLKECAKHRSEKDCWLVIHGKVYNVTDFLDEHPGGYDIVVAASGKDATEDFEEIGHSSTAKEMLNDYYIGDFEGGDSAPVAREEKKAVVQPTSSASSLLRALLPLLVIVLAIVVFYMKNM